MPITTNRIVTGHNAQGQSIILHSDQCTNVNEVPSWPGLIVTELWVSEESPVDNSGSADRALRPMTHDPVANGTIFRLVEVPPESQTTFNPGGIFAELGSTNKPSEQDSARHPTMHKTNSIDYLVVVSGEMIMAMEEGEIVIRQGDCIVQRGTNHAWINRTDKPCLLAAVLVDAKPAP